MTSALANYATEAACYKESTTTKLPLFPIATLLKYVLQNDDCGCGLSYSCRRDKESEETKKAVEQTRVCRTKFIPTIFRIPTSCDSPAAVFVWPLGFERFEGLIFSRKNTTFSTPDRDLNPDLSVISSAVYCEIHPTEIRASISPSSAVELNTTNALANYATEAGYSHNRLDCRLREDRGSNPGRRFRFCGDLDCPDWILAEINTLAKMSSVKMKLLCQQVAKSSLGEEMDYDKVKKLTSDAKFEVGDVKASVAAVEFILTSSSRHDVEEDVLSSELQQLGLPREHSMSLVRVYSDNLVAFTSKLKSESLRFSRLEDVRWRVDFVSRSSRHYIDPDIPEPEVTISLRVWDSLAGLHKMHKFTTTGDMVALLLEVEEADEDMNGVAKRLRSEYLF
uniref:COMM domain-containing protein n=1 Tax=Timema douglasi TaxID=61478 RepID=A0A7R8ZB53_TIMDO|nr:unnamed protein product [Timema douglasi]